MDDHQFRTFFELTRNGAISQRELARKIGLSLGRINYIVNALVEKGYIKAERFKNSKNKMAYMYVLTPKGASERIRQTRLFIKRKTEEYNALKHELDLLSQENEQHK